MLRGIEDKIEVLGSLLSDTVLPSDGLQSRAVAVTARIGSNDKDGMIHLNYKRGQYSHYFQARNGTVYELCQIAGVFETPALKRFLTLNQTQ